MDLIDKNGKIKGGILENNFKNWLDIHKIPFLYIEQNNQTLSPSLIEEFASKRPDFMILVPHFGFLFVDVKYRKMHTEFRNFPIDIIETKKYSSLQRKFHLEIWYVISNEDYGFKTWFWIPVSKVMELGISAQVSRKSGEGFFPIPIEEFIQVSEDDSLDRLFSKLFMK